MALTSTSSHSIKVGTCLSRLSALPSLVSCGKSSTRTLKPELPEKYDGRLNLAEFLSIYTIAIQAVGGRDEKVFANYLPLALKSNVRSWLMHLPENSISSWADLCHEFIGAFMGGHQEPGRPGTCSFSNRKKERLSASICRDSIESTKISQISTRWL